MMLAAVIPTQTSTPILALIVGLLVGLALGGWLTSEAIRRARLGPRQWVMPSESEIARVLAYALAESGPVDVPERYLRGADREPTIYSEGDPVTGRLAVWTDLEPGTVR